MFMIFFQTFMNITFLFFPLKKFIMAIRTPYYCTIRVQSPLRKMVEFKLDRCIITHNFVLAGLLLYLLKIPFVSFIKQIKIIFFDKTIK